MSSRNNADWTALMLAALNGHEQVALVPRLVLLEAGADRNKELPGLSGWIRLECSKLGSIFLRTLYGTVDRVTV